MICGIFPRARDFLVGGGDCPTGLRVPLMEIPLSNTLAEFKKFHVLYQEGRVNELAASAAGFRFLLLRSLARKEYLEGIAKQFAIKSEATIKDLLLQIFLAPITAKAIEGIIRALDEADRATRQALEADLIAQLFKLRTFDWGGIHENDINKYIVNNYVKKITNYDDLTKQIETEILESLKGFVLCSWYNNWTSIIIEDIFKSHARVLPTVGRIKQVDFFVDGIPFDLKMTYFPVGFMEDQRQRMGVVRSEVAELKKACKRFEIPVDLGRHENDLLLDMLAALSESSNAAVQKFHREFMARRRTIISETMKSPRTLLKWLYENQGIQRFDTSNRLFLIAIDQNKMEESWKLKRDHPLLKKSINEYLSTRKLTKKDLLLVWEANGSRYESYTDVLFILK